MSSSGIEHYRLKKIVYNYFQLFWMYGCRIDRQSAYIENTDSKRPVYDPGIIQIPVKMHW
jgi:hypothetical protein